MTRFLIVRLLSTVVSAWLIVTVVFFLARITGDPVALLVPDNATPAEVQAFKERLGLDRSMAEQYVLFLGRSVTGDLGQSIRHVQPALQAVATYMPATIQLAFASLVLAVVGGLALGIVAASRPGSFVDSFAMTLALIGQSVPVYWQGLMLIMIFGLQLQWLPISGRGGWEHLILPAVTLGTTQMAVFARLTRAGMLEQLSQDFIRTARSRGLSELRVTLRHALPNAAIPLVTQAGLTLGGLLAGSVITETIFAWPGVGRFALQAVYNRDFPVVQATVFLVSMVFLAINFLVDLLYTVIDPRTTVA